MSEQILYSNGSDEICYDLDYWEQYIEDEEIDSLELEEMKQDKQKYATRWCTYYGNFLDGDECGKAECKVYEPLNGSRGKCKFKTYSLVGTSKKFTLTKDGLNKVQDSKLF